MVKVSDLYEDLPVTLNSDDFERYTGIKLEDELETTGESNKIVSAFLDKAHESLYYGLIYKVAGKTIKDRIIHNYITELEKPLKMCIKAQLEYMLEAGGDYGLVDGSNTNSDGLVNITNKDIIASKIIAPKVYDILRSTRPNLISGL